MAPEPEEQGTSISPAAKIQIRRSSKLGRIAESLYG
jgi:hypothetical protein